MSPAAAAAVVRRIIPAGMVQQLMCIYTCHYTYLYSVYYVPVHVLLYIHIYTVLYYIYPYMLYARAYGEDPRPVYTVLTYFALAPPTRRRDREGVREKSNINIRTFIIGTFTARVNGK